MKALMVFGTRPEIIKCHSTYLALKERGHDVAVYWTNQNFDPTLSDDIFAEYAYDQDDFTRDWRDADVCIVQGDTWSTLEGALMKRPLAHIEAGIRSYDERMIEEKIRVLIDRYADIHFCPTKIAMENLRDELGKKGYLVGNTIQDVMVHDKAEKPLYINVTLHRPETVDHQKTLKNTMDGITLVASYFRVPVNFFCHPRTRDRLRSLGVSPSFAIMPSVKRSKFIEYLRNSLLVITDSGGVQEEAAILKVPCVTARKSTERPETVNAGLNIVAGNTIGGIFDAARDVVNNVKQVNYDNSPLYGNGDSGQKIVDILEEVI